MIVEFIAPLWRWQANESWIFVSLPTAESAVIREVVAPYAGRGFGSLRVRVTIGTTTWQTSIFPDTASGSYALPVKKAVRVREGLEVDRPAEVRVELLDL